MALKTCKECKQQISTSARRCPHCGAYQWTTGRGCFAFILIPLVILFAIIIGTTIRSCSPH